MEKEFYKWDGKTKTPPFGRIFGVDPTRFALVSPRVDGGILLHKTTGPDPRRLD